MQKLDFSLEFKKVEEASGGLPVIIVAAGSSSRMQGIDKMFAPLFGVPVLARTMAVFQNSRYISEIAVITSAQKIADVKRLAATYAIDKLSFVAEGGSSREESVKNGLMLFKDRHEKVLVHDGARPLVSDEIIGRVAEALKEYDSVTCAVKLKDTVKTVDEKGMAESTPRRESLVAVQTPQGVNIKKFLQVAEEKDLSLFTDDTSVMEAGGVKTKTVEGDYSNIKITTPEDLTVAKGIIEEEQ